MIRPLMNQSIDELEALFRTSTYDAAAVEQLRRELVHRKTPRAVQLLQKVEKSLKPHGQDALPQRQLDLSQPKPPVRTADLRQAPMFEPVIVPLIKPVDDGESTGTLPQGGVPRELSRPQRSQQPPIDMDTAKALSILGVAANASWDVVEAARRKLVARSNPSGSRLDSAAKERALTEARLVNAAYLTLAGSRTLAAKLR